MNLSHGRTRTKQVKKHQRSTRSKTARGHPGSDSPGQGTAKGINTGAGQKAHGEERTRSQQLSCESLKC